MDLFIALLPAIIMIILVIATRKVLIALSVGFILSALLLFNWDFAENEITVDILGTLQYMWESIVGILTSFDWYMPIVGFVVLIGGITAVISLAGGIHAFAEWSVKKVKNPVAAQMLTWILGLLIFIDDYFNALVIGEVSKPVTDRYKISRAKLSYIIDSTSAPIVILMPLSTWGAYIIGLMGGLFDDVGYTAHTGFSGFIASVPYQFYPLTAIIMVFLTIRLGINFGPMKHFEKGAEAGKDESLLKSGDTVGEEDVEGKNATHWTLIVPVVVLVLSTLIIMFAQSGFTPSAFLDQDITLPLFFAGILSLITAIGFSMDAEGVDPKSIATYASKGMFNMLLTAGSILVLAWLVSGTIQDLGVGNMVAEYIDEASIANLFIPVIMFLIAGFIAFATGTSWGAFGILLPIAIPVAMATDQTLMPVIIAAVLGGAVFGDHSSPVSDTTVLSATGARSTLHGHFISQVPYAAVTAFIAALGYLVYGLSGLLILSYAVVALGIFGFVMLYKKVLE